MRIVALEGSVRGARGIIVLVPTGARWRGIGAPETGPFHRSLWASKRPDKLRTCLCLRIVEKIWSKQNIGEAEEDQMIGGDLGDDESWGLESRERPTTTLPQHPPRAPTMRTTVAISGCSVGTLRVYLDNQLYLDLSTLPNLLLVGY